MISYINGQVAHIDEGYIILECSGIGYKISMPASSLYKMIPGEQAKILTFMSVKEDAISLYGFVTEAERSVFSLLLGVSGIGPKGALGILSSLSVSEIKTAVVSEDPKLIATAKGIGTKMAQKIVLELKGKIEKETAPGEDGITDISSSPAPLSEDKSYAVSVLEALGFSRSAAFKAVNSVENAQAADRQTLVEEALKIIE